MIFSMNIIPQNETEFVKFSKYYDNNKQNNGQNLKPNSDNNRLFHQIFKMFQFNIFSRIVYGFISILAIFARILHALI